MRNFFVYRKETPYPAGYVADFCPIERAITLCRIDSVRSSRYLNLLRIDAGDFVRSDRACCSCGFVVPDEKSSYPDLALKPGNADQELERKTNPGVTERFRDLIQVRERLERGAPVDADIKHSLLKEQFLWLERTAEKYWTSETTLDRVSLACGLFSLVGWFVALVVVCETIPPGRRLDAIEIFFAAGLAHFIFNVVIFFLGPRRTIGKKVIPLIATALSPLNPSPAEIETVLAQMRAEGFRYSTRVAPARLMREIEHYRRTRHRFH